MSRRVVITGYGVVSALGNDVDTFWNHIKEGKSGIKKITSDEFAGINTQIGGYIEDFTPETYLDNKEIGRYDRYIQYAYAAAMQALDKSNLY